MRFNRKAIEATADLKYCRCRHDSSVHDKNGCHGEILRFKCERRGHDDFQGEKHGTNCIILLQCPCKFAGGIAKKVVGTIVLETEKQ